MRKPVIGVMGGSEVSADVERMAGQLGKLIAERGWVLLSGGRDCGVMRASTRGAKEAGGTVIGILPDRETSARVSPHLDIAVFTGMGDARNVINVLSSDVVIALPGSAGTMSEIALALKNKKPVILLGYDGVPVGLKAFHEGGGLTMARDPGEAIAAADTILC